MDLLKKCEVSNLNQFYHKWLDENDHIVQVKKICAIHKNFNQDKVLTHVKSINDIIVINIIDFTQKKNLQNLEKQKYIVDSTGIGKILNYLRKRGFIRNISKLKDVLNKLGIAWEEHNKAISLINIAIKNKIIYALIDKAEDKKKEFILTFYSKLKHPDHRGDVIKLLITILSAAVIISVLLPIIYFINA